MRIFTARWRKQLLPLLPVMLCIALSLLVTACQNSTDPSGNTGVGSNGQSSGQLLGKVTSNTNAPISGVEVRVGTLVTYTNTKGEFFFDKVPARTRLVVAFRNDQWAPTQKIIVVPKDHAGYLEASMQPVGATQNINASTGGTITHNGMKVVFPANAFVDASGKPFTGTAQVRGTYFDPTSAAFTRCFPGDFEGVRTNGATTAIESYGFINVEIVAAGAPLQLASGVRATITVPVPAAIAGRAPATIPLWYFDETKGQWIEEGSATLTGGAYIGQVAHFTSWNCDQPTQTSWLEGHVLDGNGNPLSFATVQTTGVDYTGASRVQTDDVGYFKIPVKSSATAKVWASYYIVSGTSQDVQTPATGQTLNIGNLTVNVDTTQFCIITGRLVDNGNLPVANVHLTLKDAQDKQVDYGYSNKDGRFKFFGEAGKSYSIEVVLYIDSSKTPVTVPVTCPAVPGTIDVGDVKLNIGGSTITGRLIDTNGNPIANASAYSGESNGNPGQSRESKTDATGRFTLSARPNITFQIYFYFNQQSKTVPVTSGNLGETKDIGDVTFP